MEKPSLVLLCCAQFIIFSSVQASPSAKVLTIHEARGNPASINNYNKNKKPPLILASGYDMSVPINPPPSTDLHSTGDDIYLNINNSKVRVNLDHYDEKIFSLAYRVFIMNDKIGFAYKIASVAVKQNPKNIE